MNFKIIFYSSSLGILTTYGVQARHYSSYFDEIEKDITKSPHFLKRENALTSAPKLDLILGELKNKLRPKLIRQNAVDFSSRPRLERKKAIYNIYRHAVLHETPSHLQILQNQNFKKESSIAIETIPVKNFKALTPEEAREQLEIALNIQQAFHQRKFTEFYNILLKPETKEHAILGSTLNPLLDVILGELVSISKLQNGHVRKHAFIPAEFSLQ